MKKLDVLEPNVLKAYNKADEKGKAMLAEMFGKELFNRKIIDRIKTVDDVFAELGIDPETVLTPSEEDANLKTLRYVAKALREGNDNPSVRYEPIMKLNNAGRWVFDCYCNWTSSSLGSRLVYLDTPEKAKYLGEQFEDLINKVFNSKI